MRRPPLLFLFLVAAAAPGLVAAPVINSIANGASNIPFNSPVALGSIFVIKGTGLGPANISISPAPFKTTSLSGTSVAVTVGGTTVNAPIYYTSATQVAVLLPSNTPLPGQGAPAPTFTVTYNGQTSAGVNHGITRSNVGVFTVDSTGQGPGIVTFGDYSLVSAGKSNPCGGPNTACGSANPGDTLILWATGVGPVTGDDTSGAGLGQNMPDVPLTLWIGGVQAAVTYQGRSGCCIGEDQIVFVVPDNVPTGCAVPLVVQVGATSNTVSNTTMIPIAPKGSRDCTPVDSALASVPIEQGVMAGPATFGTVEVDRRSSDGGQTFQDSAQLVFARIKGYATGSQPFFASYLDVLPVGTCAVYANLDGPGGPPIAGLEPIDAGSSFTIQGPNGSMNLTANTDNNISLSTAGTFLVPGTFTVRGSGGADVGPFSATFTIPPSPKLTNGPNFAPNATVTRSNGVTVTWNPNGSTGTVQILLLSSLNNAFTDGAIAACRAAANAGTFAIPPYVLLALPAGNFTAFELSPGSGPTPAASVPFSANGLSIGLSQVFIDGARMNGYTLR